MRSSRQVRGRDCGEWCPALNPGQVHSRSTAAQCGAGVSLRLHPHGEGPTGARCHPEQTQLGGHGGAGRQLPVPQRCDTSLPPWTPTPDGPQAGEGGVALPGAMCSLRVDHRTSFSGSGCWALGICWSLFKTGIGCRSLCWAGAIMLRYSSTSSPRSGVSSPPLSQCPVVTVQTQYSWVPRASVGLGTGLR